MKANDVESNIQIQGAIRMATRIQNTQGKQPRGCYQIGRHVAEIN